MVVWARQSAGAGARMESVYWQRALQEAQQAVGLSDPNPRVGCVLVAPDGQILAQGHTQEAGGPHAEVMALRDAASHHVPTQGCTAYVTLEPCSHFGRTPPCADALVAAGVARVVVAMADPNPLVAGQGVARLRAAGVSVDVLSTDDPVAVAAKELNIGFLSRVVRHRPWVRVKMAASLDGRTALDNGESQWITGAAARADGHAWRARATAVMTGIGTVLDDDPGLDVREVSVARQPWCVVLDSRWRTPASAKLLRQAERKVLIYGVAPAEGDAAASARMSALKAAGAELVPVAAQASGQVDLAQVLSDLARKGVNELHVEAGARLNAALIQGNWVDEGLVYLAPKLIGPGRGMAALPPLAQLSDAPTWVFHEVCQIGQDVRIIARPAGRADFC